MARVNRVDVWRRLLESGIRPGTARAIHPDGLLEQIGLPWNAGVYNALFAWLGGHGFVLGSGRVLVAE